MLSPASGVHLQGHLTGRQPAGATVHFLHSRQQESWKIGYPAIRRSFWTTLQGTSAYLSSADILLLAFPASRVVEKAGFY